MKNKKTIGTQITKCLNYRQKHCNHDEFEFYVIEAGYGRLDTDPDDLHLAIIKRCKICGKKDEKKYNVHLKKVKEISIYLMKHFPQIGDWIDDKGCRYKKIINNKSEYMSSKEARWGYYTYGRGWTLEAKCIDCGQTSERVFSMEELNIALKALNLLIW